MKKGLLCKWGILSLLAAGIGLAAFAKGKSRPVEAVSTDEIFGPQKDTPLITENINYFKDVEGFLAKPEGIRPKGGVVMIHEWWGLNNTMREMAMNLAREGYVVLAVDLYKGEVTKNPERAQLLSSSVNQNEATDNLIAAVSYLRENENVQKVASLGWCFGGGQSLQLALSDVPLDATIIYYGMLTSDKNRLAKIKWPVLAVFGDMDQLIPLENVNSFKKVLDELGVSNEVLIYSGVGHAFANPTGPNYAPVETRDAWDKTLLFLKSNLN